MYRCGNGLGDWQHPGWVSGSRSELPATVRAPAVLEAGVHTGPVTYFGTDPATPHGGWNWHAPTSEWIGPKDAAGNVRRAMVATITDTHGGWSWKAPPLAPAGPSRGVMLALAAGVFFLLRRR